MEQDYNSSSNIHGLINLINLVPAYNFNTHAEITEEKFWLF